MFVWPYILPTLLSNPYKPRLRSQMGTNVCFSSPPTTLMQVSCSHSSSPTSPPLCTMFSSLVPVVLWPRMAELHLRRGTLHHHPPTINSSSKCSDADTPSSLVLLFYKGLERDVMCISHLQHTNTHYVMSEGLSVCPPSERIVFLLMFLHIQVTFDMQHTAWITATGGAPNK